MTNEHGENEQQAPLDLSDTIWSEVDRVLAGITARPDRSVLDLMVHILSLIHI